MCVCVKKKMIVLSPLDDLEAVVAPFLLLTESPRSSLCIFFCWPLFVVVVVTGVPK